MAPFSGKQKKEQLKAKREKKREANERRHQREAEDEQRELHSTAMEMARNNRQQVDDAGSSTSSHSHCESDGCEPHKDARKARPPRRVDPQASLEEKSEEMKYGADRKGIRSVFAKESSAQVEERKRLTYEPLHHRLMMAKTGIAFGRWFAMPHDAELLVSEDKKKQRTRRRRATSSSESDVDDAEAEERKTDASEKQTEEPSLVRPSPLGDAASHSWISSAGGSMAFPISVELPSRGWKVNSEGEIVETSTGYMDNTRRMKEGDEDSLHQRDVDLEALDAAHYESYLRALDKVQLPDHLRGLELSNYERNLDVWRQMWRTVEISDVVVLVADARYPIIHLPISLLTYITRTCHKPCVAVLNKSDLVPPSTLQSWLHFLTRYLRLAGLNVMESPTPATPDTWRDHLRTGWNGPTGAAPLVFATFTADPQLNKPLNVGDGAAYTRRPKLKRRAKFYEVLHEDLRQRMGKGAALEADSSGEEDEDERSGTHYDRCERFKGMKEAERNLSDAENPAVLGAVANALIRLLLPCRALTDIFREQHPHEPHPVHAEESVEAPPMVASHLPVAAARRAKRKTTKQKRTAKMQSTRAIEEESSDEGTEDDRSSDEVLDDRFPDDLRYAHLGFIGYPNVGKSSLLNCLRGAKVVSVSATAGHTKHLQTIPIPSQHITLVDCPGLVFPVFGIPRPLQAIVGSHQIAQTRDPQSSVAYLATHIPLEKLYGLQRPDGENEGDEPWTPYDLCEAYARKRGYFVKRGKGVPDVHRASLSILQEAFDGQLTIFFAPPELNLLDSQVFQAALAPWLSLSVQQQKNTSNDNVLEES